MITHNTEQTTLAALKMIISLAPNILVTVLEEIGVTWFSNLVRIQLVVDEDDDR